MNTLHPNLDANHDGLGLGIVNIVFAKDNSYDVCNVTQNDRSKPVARTEIINQAAVGKLLFVLNAKARSNSNQSINSSCNLFGRKTVSLFSEPVRRTQRYQLHR